MDFQPVDDLDVLSEIEGTPITPIEEGDYPKDLLSKFVSQKDKTGGATEYSVDLFEEKEGYFQLDLDLLAHLIWEHKQYSAAHGFSPSQMDVLRIVQLLSDSKGFAHYEDIVSELEGEYSKNTVSNALSGLVDKQLLRRKAQGVYLVNSFDEYQPERDSVY
ncbi:MAG: hypothetical protein ABEI86_00400 [Halobacteriaceae archaeon]